MTNTMFQECIDIVKDLVGNEYLYFDEAVEVKTTPHSHPFNAWAVSVSPDDQLFVMDSDEQWHQLQAEDLNAAVVIGSLYQRLKLMRINYAKAS
ncbi:MAG: hypothetical protein ACJ75B_05350 [Flavisolibacter sp.]